MVVHSYPGSTPRRLHVCQPEITSLPCSTPIELLRSVPETRSLERSTIRSIELRGPLILLVFKLFPPKRCWTIASSKRVKKPTRLETARSVYLSRLYIIERSLLTNATLYGVNCAIYHFYCARRQLFVDTHLCGGLFVRIQRPQSSRPRVSW